MSSKPFIADFSAFELAGLIRNKDISALEATEAALQRVDDVDGSPGTIGGDPKNADGVHAFITVTAEVAKEEARKVDDQIARGEIPGPLAGVPYTVKDIFTVKGTLASAASKILANFVSPYTATTVLRMRQAGAIMLGKVNLDEFTYGSSNESSAYQPSPRNPWNLDRVPGGSSGGSGARHITATAVARTVHRQGSLVHGEGREEGGQGDPQDVPRVSAGPLIVRPVGSPRQWEGWLLIHRQRQPRARWSSMRCLKTRAR